MGLMDSFTSDSPVELKHGEYYKLMREAARAELIENAVKADVPGYYITAMLTGKLEMPVYDAELNTEVQIEETTEEWGSMVSAIRGIFDRRTTEKQIKETSGHILALICEFEQMRKEELEKEKIIYHTHFIFYRNFYFRHLPDLPAAQRIRRGRFCLY